MDNQNERRKSKRFYKWFKRKLERPEPYDLGEVSGKLASTTYSLCMVTTYQQFFFFSFFFANGEGNGDEDIKHSYVRSMEMDPCTSSNELR